MKNATLVGLMDLEKQKLYDLIAEYDFSQEDLQMILSVVLFEARFTEGLDYRQILSSFKQILKKER